MEVGSGWKVWALAVEGRDHVLVPMHAQTADSRQQTADTLARRHRQP